MTNVSMKLARTITVGVWSIASMALAGQAKTTAGCYEGGAHGKAVPTAKTQEECQKLGDKFVWTEASVKEHEHKAAHGKKGKEKVQAKTEVKTEKTEMKTETKPAEATEAAPAAAPAATEAPKK